MALTLNYLNTLSEKERTIAILKEKIKCAKDPYYTITNYFDLIDPATGESAPFKMYPYQTRAVEDFQAYDYCMTMKTRQTGLTTISQAYAAWFMSTRKKVIVNALAQDKKRSKKFLKGVRDFLDAGRKKAPWLIPEYSESNNGKEEFALTNKSLISAEANKPDACRGETINLLVVDEVAAITWMEDIWASAGLTLTRSRGKCIAISCVTKDTYVFTDKGIQQVCNFIPINIDPTIQRGYYLEKEYSVKGKDKFRNSDLFYCNGKSNIHKITTRFSEIKGSEKHKLWCFDNQSNSFKIKPLKEITTKDYVNIQYNQQIWGNDDDVSSFDPKITPNHKIIFSPKTLTPDICYLLGLYISEGSAYKVIRNKSEVGGSVSISCGDDISNIFNKLNLPFSEERLTKRIDSLSLVRFLEYLGFDISKHAHEKVIPGRLLRCSKECLVALLQGIFDGDGSSNVTNGNVSLASSSSKLIEQIRIILLNFGCLSHVYKTTVDDLNKNLPYGWNKFNFDGYSLQLYSTEALKYYQNIGFRLERKQNNIKKLKTTIERNNDLLPNGKEIVKKLYSLTNLTPWKLATYKKIYIPLNCSSKKKIEQLIGLILEENPNLVNHPYIVYLQDKVLIKDSVWVPVKTREILKEQDLTYDFSLPYIKEDEWCHSVVYNGFLGEQTPKGQSGWYFDQYTNAEELNWKIIDAHWSEHPLYKQGMYQWIKDLKHPEGGYIKFFNDEWPDTTWVSNLKKYGYKENYRFVLDGKMRSPWYDFESKKLGARLTKCELDCSFAGSGGEVLDSDVIRGIMLKAKEYSQLNQPLKGPWSSYKEYISYNPLHEYIVVADTMTGDGSDYSAAVVIDLQTLEICATFKDQLEQQVYAKIINDIGLRYGKALVIVEIQNGGTCLYLLKDKYKYPKLYYTTLKAKQVDKKERKRKLGFWQSESTRKLGGDKLESVLISGELKIPCMSIVNELNTWVWSKRGRRDHATGKHDDLLMALTMGVFYIFYVHNRANTNTETTRKSFEYKRETVVMRNNHEVENVFHDLLDESNVEYSKFLLSKQTNSVKKEVCVFSI